MREICISRLLLSPFAYSQGFTEQAEATIVMVPAPERKAEKHGKSSWSYTCIEAGYVENLSLHAVPLTISRVIGKAINTRAVKKLLKLPEEKTALCSYSLHRNITLSSC